MSPSSRPVRRLAIATLVVLVVGCGGATVGPPTHVASTPASSASPPVTFANPFVGAWLDADGQPVPDDEPEGEGFVLTTWVVTDHCDWGSATFLLVAWPPGRVDPDFLGSNIEDGSVRLFVRDPDRLFAGRLVGTFDDDAELPASATATGLHRGDWEIWMSDDEDMILLVGPDRVERWQRSATEIWCA